MQTFIYCKVTLHVSGVTAPIAPNQTFTGEQQQLHAGHMTHPAPPEMKTDS